MRRPLDAAWAPNCRVGISALSDLVVRSVPVAAVRLPVSRRAG